jgi:glyoxylase-like metal-dependent hydrolase (beta-lactamase superfamily II)
MLRTAVALAMAAASVANAANTETRAELSQARARIVLDRAVEANGGVEALRAIEVVRLRLEGQTFPRLQMTTPAPPFEGGGFDETLLLDLEGNRMRLDQKATGFGFDGDNTVTIADGTGNTYDNRVKTVTPIPAEQATQQQFIQYHRRLPTLLLRSALERSNSLRYLGDDVFEGRRQEVVTFVMPDTQQIALYVDAETGLISKYELLFVDSVEGVEASEIVFGNYRKVGDYQVPGSWQQRLLGVANADYAAEVEFNPAVSDDSFRVAAAGYTQVQPAPVDFEEKVERLADGVFVIHNVAGQNQNTLAVGFADHVVAVEAPGSSDGADAVIKRIHELFPGKPIRYVAMTHHHGDHIGGMRSYIAEGAAVVTTAANRPVIEAMAASQQNDRLGSAPRKPEFLPLENGRRVLEDGSRRLELIDIGPNPHAKEMVIAWLPAEKVVFQGDLFFVPNNGAPFGPPQPSTASFVRKLRELALPAEKVASVHGETASIAQFREATASVN